MIKELKETVKKLMEEYTDLRDNDNELIYAIWAKECQMKGLPSDSYNILSQFRQKQLSSPDVITRARRHVEEENENLRGKTYEKRQIKGAQVKEEIIEMSHAGDLNWLTQGMNP